MPNTLDTGQKAPPDAEIILRKWELSNAVIQSAFNYSNGYISSDDTTPLRAKIYGFQIMQMPTRVEETATGLGRYSIALSMMYRAV